MPPRITPVLIALALIQLVFASAHAAEETPAAGAPPRAMLELFTSQGCAACPPADALLGELAGTDGLIGITMPTRVWDYLGWEDTLATDALTKRQMTYATSLDGTVFTPQVVVNGVVAVVGSDREAIETAVAETAEPFTLPITLSASGGVLSVAMGEGNAGAREVTVWLAVISEAVTVPVRKGENRGRDLTYHNVVRSLRPIGMWKGKPLALDLPLTDVTEREGTGAVVFAQIDTFKGPGTIVGAAMLKTLFPSKAVAGVPGARP